MKNSFSVFIVVLFCAVLCIGLGFLNRDTSDVSGWNPNELYSNPVLSGGSSAFTNASLSSSDVPVGSSVVSMRGGSVSNSPFRHSSSAIYPSAVSSYAPAGVAYGHSSMSNGVSPIAHMTSSAEYRSFGGGSNGGAAMGGSMRSAAASSTGASYSAPTMSFSTPVLAKSNSTSINVEVMTQNSGVISGYDAASYDYSSVFGGKNSIVGRRNPSPTDDDPWYSTLWWNWLDWQYKQNADGDYLYDHWGTQNGDGTWLFTHQDAESAYEAWCDYMRQAGMAGQLPTYDEWLLWFMGTKEGDDFYTGMYGRYKFIPVGGILPLLMFVFMYVAVLFYRKRTAISK